MSGIDKIISEIETDTKKVCDGIIAQAKAKAEEIISAAEAQARSVVADGKEKTAAKVVEIKKRGDSAADLEEKKIMLFTKQSVINDMLQKGIESVKELPEDAYFELLLRMVEKYSLPEEGVIEFSSDDIARVPSGFLDKLNTVAKGKLALSESAADIDAGFILKYGGIEQNCSFDAIFASEAENLSDRAGRLLF